MSALRYLAALAVLTFLIAGPLGAQDRPLELGLDAAFVVSLTDDANGMETDNITVIGVPFQRLRVGFFISDRFEIEPILQFNFVNVGDSDLLQLGLFVDGAYHFTSDPARPRAYLTASGGLDLLSADDESDTQWVFGGGVGVKLPVADQLAVRLEGGVRRAFESDDRLGATNLAALVGLSFFTK